MITAKGIYLAASAAVAALGVVASLPAFGVGLAFAAAGGFVAMALEPPTTRIDKWLTLTIALLIGVLAAILHPHVPLDCDLPVQAVMGIAGIASRRAADRARNLDFTLPGRKGAKE